MTNHNGTVRRFECTVPVGELLPGEPFDIGVRIVAPDSAAAAPTVALYCLPGGQTNLTYFDLGDDEDRRFSFAEAMARQGHVVICADHPAIGASTHPRDEYDLTPDLLARAHVSAAGEAMARLRAGTLTSGLEALPNVTLVGCGHSMGAVMIIAVQARSAVFAGLVLLGYGAGGLPDILPAQAVESARDPDWLATYLPTLVRERFGTALQSPEAARASRRGKGKGSPSFHTDNADPDGKLALRGAAAPLLTMPGLYAMFPGVSDRASAQIEVPVLVVTGTHDFVQADDRLRHQFAKSADLRMFHPHDTGHNLFIFPSRNESFAQIGHWAARFASS